MLLTIRDLCTKNVLQRSKTIRDAKGASNCQNGSLVDIIISNIGTVLTAACSLSMYIMYNYLYYIHTVRPIEI